MTEVKLLENKFGTFSITLEEDAEFVCLGGPARTRLHIEYIPDKDILEFMSFREWLSENYNLTDTRGTVESVGHEIFKFLVNLLKPKSLRLTNSCGEAEKHGPASATFEKKSEES